MFKHKTAVITVSTLPIREILADAGKLTFEYPAQKIWNPNGISLMRRLDDGDITAGQVSDLLSPETLTNYLVAADIIAPTRCIDGRITKGWDASEPHETLGPKVAGGTAHAALTHRIVDFNNLKHELLFERDIHNVIDIYSRLGFGFGGHIDDHQAIGNTGCGAVDNIDLILDRLQLPEPQEQLRGICRMIMGDGYDPVVTNEMIGRILYLDALKPRYMPKENDDPNGAYLYKKTIAETIRSEAHDQSEHVPALSGTHNEVALVLNYRNDTTIDTDRLSFDHDNKLQVFGWDVWEMYEEAERLYPYDMRDPTEVQRSTVENRVRHITTRTLLGIATTMVLTDGSLKLVTVQ